MVSSFGQISSVNTAKRFCRIVGLTCLAGFAIDCVVLFLPPNPLLIEWRAAFLQQVSDRSIVLLLGAALTLYGFVDSRQWLRPIALLSLLVGVVFSLSCLLVVHDVSVLQKQSFSAINDQATQLQTRIQAAQNNPANLPENVTLEQLNQASEQIAGQAQTLKQDAEAISVRTGVVSVGNLLIAGLGLISIGRYGVRLRRG